MQKVTVGLGLIGFSSLPFVLSKFLFPKVLVDAHTRIPLPGALAGQDAFLEACIGCGLCGEVCPPDCIKFHSVDGGFASNTPYIDPSRKACILCGYCMEICPTEALTVTDIREVDMGTAQIDQVACYPWVDKGVCGACFAICPLGDEAIKLEFRKSNRSAVPVIQEGCVGCGQCVEVCPEPSLPIRIVDRSQGTVARHGVAIRKKPEMLKF